MQQLRIRVRNRPQQAARTFVDLPALQFVGMHLELGIAAGHALQGALAGGLAAGSVGRRAVGTVQVGCGPIVIALAGGEPLAVVRRGHGAAERAERGVAGKRQAGRGGGLDAARNARETQAVVQHLNACLHGGSGGVFIARDLEHGHRPVPHRLDALHGQVAQQELALAAAAVELVKRVHNEDTLAVAHDGPAARSDQRADCRVVGGADSLGAGQSDTGTGIGDEIDGGHSRVLSR